jgi:hypothetical protein
MNCRGESSLSCGHNEAIAQTPLPSVEIGVRKEAVADIESEPGNHVLFDFQGVVIAGT